jgi:deoxyhypusine synthase
MKKRSRFLQVPIEPFTVDPELRADEILEKMERISFQGRSLGVAHRIWQKMLADVVTIFMCSGGAL